MPKFFYRAYTKNKERKEGFIDAESKSEALAKLDKLSLYPTNISEFNMATRDIAKGSTKKINSSDVAIFTRQISNLLDAGLTILASLVLISRQTLKTSLKLVAEKLIEDLKAGKAFSDCLVKYPYTFSSLYVSLIRSGEAGGFLPEVMKRLADFMENEEEIKMRIRAAMIYPILIAAVGLITIFLLLGFVIPKLVLVFEDFGQVLPLPTQILIDLSAFVSQFWWLIVLVIAVILFLTKRLLKTPEGRSSFQRFQLRIPVVGGMILKRQLERFSRILATLLGNGVTILPSLEIVRDIMENDLLRQEVNKIHMEVRDGSSLARAISRAKYFPISLANIVSVGEESGSLEKVLSKVAGSFERELDRNIKIFISLLEPLMILVMGSIVAFIVTAMLLPVFQINFMVG